MKNILLFLLISLSAAAQPAPKEKGVNLRIFDDNIWAYDKDESPDIWKQAGIECTNAVRGPQFADLIHSYSPDVIGLQECSMPMREVLNPLLPEYREVWDIPEGEKNGTPVYYNTGTINLIDSGYTLYTPQKWSNGNSKSYTWALLELKSCGSRFVVISTHLWWKSESVLPGSNMARASQVRLIMAEAEGLKARYNCPIFVVGDMNCWESSIAIQQFLTAGYQPCYKLATHLTDDCKGHHKCAPGTVGVRDGLEKPRSEAIDHCLLYNGGDTEIRNFICDTSDSIVLLTDHCPNIIDAVIK